jgi:hypothetical protein
MSRPRILSARAARVLAPALVPALVLAACGDPPATSVGTVSSGRASAGQPGTHRQYGTPVPVGEGRARAYVVYDQKDGGAPLEIGVALDERAVHGLPAPRPNTGGGSHEHEHLDNHAYLLALPPRGAAPFQFVELDWNPGGHEPPGIYDVPHFDFHFWTASRETRAGIVPTAPQYAEHADQLPPEAQRAPFYAVAAAPGAPPASAAVPLMGVHWVDTRSPELQPPGSPTHRPFTTTFIWGSWAGRFVFLEPMITRAHIMAKKDATDPAARDEVIPVPTPAQVGAPGYYPGAYRITWDEQAREYRIALTQLAPRG